MIKEAHAEHGKMWPATFGSAGATQAAHLRLEHLAAVAALRAHQKSSKAHTMVHATADKTANLRQQRRTSWQRAARPRALQCESQWLAQHFASGLGGKALCAADPRDLPF